MGFSATSVLKKITQRKPLWAFQDENSQDELIRSWGLFSLIMFGIGGTVGSGIFVLAGQIAQQEAGPATMFSFAIAGFVSLLTALSYCELAAILQSPGSSYSFSAFGLGQGFSIVAAYLVSLEYGISGAAVSRSWGDKVTYWVNTNNWVDCPETDCWINAVNGTTFSPAALLISAFMVFLILRGVQIEKMTVNILVSLKVVLVIFVIIVGFVYMDPQNLTPVVPPTNSGGPTAGGATGIMTGATMAFFGFVGWDEVTCMSGEAKRPKKDIPRAVMATIVSITILYVLASFVLTGMVKYVDIDPNEGFGSAFEQVGARWAMQITLVGEILIVLPTVVLVSYIPQSRLLYSVSRDGQMPKIFSRVRNGTLFQGTLISGSFMTLIAGFVPFTNLNDLISGGILLSFIFTNSSLMFHRTKYLGGRPIFALVFCLGVTCAILNKTDMGQTVPIGTAIVFGVLSMLAFAYLTLNNQFTFEFDTFKVPLVPYIPTLAILCNWYLFFQLSWLGIGLVVALVAFGLLTYSLYGFHHATDYSEMVDPNHDLETEDKPESCRSTSMPHDLREKEVQVL